MNVSNEWGRKLAGELADQRRAPLVTFGFAEDAEIRPEELVLDTKGAHFTAGGIEIRSRLRGRFNVENALGVVAAGILLDVPEADIAAGVEALDGVPGRFEYWNVNALANRADRITCRVCSKSSSVSPGKPTMMSVVIAACGIAARTRSRISR